jgi:hypothetical protein
LALDTGFPAPVRLGRLAAVKRRKEKSIVAPHPPMPKKIGTELILSSVSLLIGILLLSIGHYDESRLLFYIGLCITLVGVVMGVTFLFILKKT